MSSDSVTRSVLDVYDAIGREGSRSPMGPALATGGALARELGYSEADLAGVPGEVLDAFVGAAALSPLVGGGVDGRVADLGCGAGLDSYLLSRRGFRVAAVDWSPPMLSRLCRSRAARIDPIRAVLPAIPIRDRGVSWVVMNGVANLVPDRFRLLREVRRVLRPGGVFLAADLFAIGPVADEIRGMPEAWAWCVAGAARPEGWARELGLAGFGQVRVDIQEEFPPLARGVLRAERAG